MLKTILRDMDLYKGIILASLLLLPAAGWWAMSLDKRIQLGERAIAAAESRILPQIGGLQREAEEVKENVRRGGSSIDEAGGHRAFFQNMIFRSSQTPMSASDFTISQQQDMRVSRLKAVDHQVTVEFKRGGQEAYALPRDYITALLYNIESAGSQIWKLRQLRIRNEDAERLVRQKQAPPPELGDSWFVERMIFARRSPEPTDR